MASLQNQHRILEQSNSSNTNTSNELSLDSVRDSLTRLEDTIVFALIERAKFPRNQKAYDRNYLNLHAGNARQVSLAELFVRETEELQAKAGRYQNPEEVPFFPDHLLFALVPPYNFPQELYPPAASVNVSQTIWNMYFTEFLPLFTADGDDGNYASTLASDLVCLQALSRRIHLGRFVAEAKYRDAPTDYTPAIQAKDTDTLMNLLTIASVEEAVKLRVQKKAMVFGQDVTLDGNNDSMNNSSSYKVDPSIVGRLYGERVIPLTKVVEVDYLLRRLN